MENNIDNGSDSNNSIEPMIIQEEEEDEMDEVINREININLLEDFVEEEELQQERTHMLTHIVHFAILVVLIDSIILIMTFGEPGPFGVVQAIFIASLCVVHGLSIILKIRTSNEISNVSRFFLLNADLHYLTILMMFVIADLTPILHVMYYIVAYTSCMLTYISGNLKNLFGKGDWKMTRKLKKIASNDFFSITPAILEIAMTIYLIVVTIFRISIFCFTTLFVYIFIIIMYNYSVNKKCRSVWTSCGSWIKNYLKPLVPLVHLFAKIGDFSDNFYK